MPTGLEISLRPSPVTIRLNDAPISLVMIPVTRIACQVESTGPSPSPASTKPRR